MTIETDILVIGAGSGGLSVAAGAVQMGARTVLIERGAMGGDCLNVGCVPSKSLIAAASRRRAIETSRPFGIDAGAAVTDMAAVREHVRSVIAGIAPHDSAERFEGLGVRVIRAQARFTGPRKVEADGTVIEARRVVIATGSRPALPPIPGLDPARTLTNETVFDLAVLPAHLIVIGGGAIGCELAQAVRRLGAAVTVLEKFAILPRDDPDAVAVVRASLQADGIDLRENASIEAVEHGPEHVLVRLTGGESVRGSHLLVATGRKPNVEELDLDKAGVAHDAHGITVDRSLKTSARGVFAIGDVTGGLQFTHMAGHHASIVVRQALFRLPARVETRAVPWVTFTDPELAQVGLTEEGARNEGLAVSTTRTDLADNDRARTARETQGFVKLVIDRRGRPVGATIVGAHAGEMISLWVMAIARKTKLSAIAGAVFPYPTLSEASKRAAGAHFTPTLFSDRTRRLVRLLLSLP